jgi:hypothetical protein
MYTKFYSIPDDASDPLKLYYQDSTWVLVYILWVLNFNSTALCVCTQRNTSDKTSPGTITDTITGAQTVLWPISNDC